MLLYALHYSKQLIFTPRAIRRKMIRLH